MDVTDVLRDRMGEPSGLQWMTAASIAAHVVVFATFLLMPGAWLSHQSNEPVNAMTITLGGGGDGPQNGGLTPMSARPVQAEALPDAPREALRPPAQATPQMTVPMPEARRAAPAAATVKQAPAEARGRTPTRGAQTSPGNAVAVTGARGEGFGLSSGGGPGVQGTLDVGNFCCPDYLVTMVTRIKGNWSEKQNITGMAVVKFTIRRDGVLENIELERSSNYPIADLAAQRSVILTKQLPPLPDAFPNESLTVHLNFQYQR
jgi:TonB family protein